jgi:RNA polymerase sigma-70 factor (ECF subfamily)
MELSEQELAEKFMSRNSREQAFKLIISEYQERLYWHIRKIVIRHEDADDVLQNTFIKVWQNADSFRGDSSIFTWLYRIATNESLNFLRKEKNRNRLSWDDIGSKLAGTLESDEFFNGDVIQKKFQEAILTLPERQRLVFNMKYFDELKYEEIAEILDLTVGALKASYHHAVKKIKNILENH